MEEVKEEIKAFGIAQSGHQEAKLNFHYILIVTIKGEGNSPPQNNEEKHSIWIVHKYPVLRGFALLNI